MLKWPRSVTMVRHGYSVANEHRLEKIEGYDEFREKFEKELEALTPAIHARRLFPSNELREMAARILEKYAPDFNDYDTKLTDEGWRQARVTGKKLPGVAPKPKIIYYSPYQRTRETLEGLMDGWPELKGVKRAEDDRLREREHGRTSIYGDWRLNSVFNPQAALLYKISEHYEFRQPNGENVMDTRDRIRSFISTLIREHGGLPQTWKDQMMVGLHEFSQGGVVEKAVKLAGVKADTVSEDVMLVTHGLTILAMKSVFDRWDREKFTYEHHNNLPVNCGVTIYRGKESDPGRSRQGRHGRLILDPKENNMKLY